MNQDYPSGVLASNHIVQNNRISRVRLTPNKKCLIISLVSGPVVLVHDFDFLHAKEDLNLDLNNFCQSIRMLQNVLTYSSRTHWTLEDLPQQCIRNRNRLEFLKEVFKKYFSLQRVELQRNKKLVRKRLFCFSSIIL